MRNMYFHAMPEGMALPSSEPRKIAILAAVMLPTADNACSVPSAPVRERSGKPSATRATANPNTPPTPRPVTNRYAAKSTQPFENADRPVQTEYNSTVNVSVLARPIRSPTAPKINPPVAHPATNIAVA